MPPVVTTPSPTSPSPAPSSPVVGSPSSPITIARGPNHAPGRLPPPAAPPRLIGHSRAPAATGVVAKAPNFYEDFTGTKLPELNAVMASGKLLRSNTFQFIGTNQGRISPNVPALFVFGIDRSGNLPTGPFPGRPNIKFDAGRGRRPVNPSSAPTAEVVGLQQRRDHHSAER